MFCKNCGRSLKENENFCPSCGAKIEKASKVKSEKKSNSSIVSIVLGIISIVMPLIGLPLAIIGLIFGIKAKKEEKNPVGMILSIIGLVFSILLICFMILIFALAVTEEENYGERDYSNYSDSFDEYFDRFDDYFDEDMDDRLEGYKWKFKDGSILYLYENGKYIWYQSDMDHKDNYTEGTYILKEKEDAVDYIARNFSEYNLSKEEQYKFFSNSKDSIYKLENYVYIGLDCTKNITDGKESELALGLVPYFGFYDRTSDSLEVSNAKTSSSATFVRYGKIG